MTGMKPLVRRLLIVAAIAIVGGGAGLALGSFVAGGPSREAAALNDLDLNLDDGTIPAGNARDMAAAPPPLRADAPQNYLCQGCDAGLHNDMVPGNESALAPLPPYHPQEGVIVPVVSLPDGTMPSATPSAPPARTRPTAGSVRPEPATAPMR